MSHSHAPELLFHGAAGEVTGSMHLIRVEGRWIALDCGLFQGKRDDSEAKNRAWPMKPADISAVILSHAHIDHAGRLPKLARDGFDGPIYCTPATRDLCAIMLPDSAHIQEEDAFFLNKRRARKGLAPIEPLYDENDAVSAIQMMQTVSYSRWIDIGRGVQARFHEAGHMLGSAGVELTFAKHDGGASSLYFTGDVGRPNKPILRDPAPFPQCDYIICESTYGGRVSETIDRARETLTQIIQRTYARGGKVIIPAFSVGRTQSIVYFMNEQISAGKLPDYPIFVDSPLAVSATEVFRMHPECYDAEARALLERKGDILGAGRCVYIREREASMALHERREPCTIISASGMCEAGRVRHHLRNNIRNAKNTVLLPGYQAQNTLGRRLADGVKKVTLFHEELDVKAEVVQLDGFSAHADHADLLRMLAPLQKSTRAVTLVHGEREASGELAAALRGAGFAKVESAERGMRRTL